MPNHSKNKKLSALQSLRENTEDFFQLTSRHSAQNLQEKEVILAYCQLANLLCKNIREQIGQPRSLFRKAKLSSAQKYWFQQLNKRIDELSSLSKQQESAEQSAQNSDLKGNVPQPSPTSSTDAAPASESSPSASPRADEKQPLPNRSEIDEEEGSDAEGQPLLLADSSSLSCDQTTAAGISNLLPDEKQLQQITQNILSLLPGDDRPLDAFATVMTDFYNLLQQPVNLIQKQEVMQLFNIIRDSLCLAETRQPCPLDQLYLEYLKEQLQVMFAENIEEQAAEEIKCNVLKILGSNLLHSGSAAAPVPAAAAAAAPALSSVQMVDERFKNSIDQYLKEASEIIEAIVKTEYQYAIGKEKMSSVRFMRRQIRGKSYYSMDQQRLTEKEFNEQPLLRAKLKVNFNNYKEYLQWWKQHAKKYRALNNAAAHLVEYIAKNDNGTEAMARLQAIINPKPEDGSDTKENDSKHIEDHTLSLLEFAHQHYEALNEKYNQYLKNKIKLYKDHLKEYYFNSFNNSENSLSEDILKLFNKIFDYYAFCSDEECFSENSEIIQAKNMLIEQCAGLKINMLIHDIRGYVRAQLATTKSELDAERAKFRDLIHQYARHAGLPCLIAEGAPVATEAQDFLDHKHSDVASASSSMTDAKEEKEVGQKETDFFQPNFHLVSLPEIKIETLEKNDESIDLNQSDDKNARIHLKISVGTTTAVISLGIGSAQASISAVATAGASGKGVMGIPAISKVPSISMGALTFLCALLTNTALVYRETNDGLVMFRLGQLFINADGEEISALRKALVLTLGVLPPVTTGIAEGALAAQALYVNLLAPILGRKFLAAKIIGISIALGPLFLMIAGMSFLLMIDSSGKIKNFKWSDVTFFFYKVLANLILWKEMNASQRMGLILRGTVRVLATLLAKGIGVIYGIANYTVLNGDVYKLLCLIPGVKQAATWIAAKVISMMAAVTLGYFSSISLTKLSEKITLRSVTKTAMHLVLSPITFFVWGISLFAKLVGFYRKKTNKDVEDLKTYSNLFSSWCKFIDSSVKQTVIGETFSRLDDKEQQQAQEQEEMQPNGFQKTARKAGGTVEKGVTFAIGINTGSVAALTANAGATPLFATTSAGASAAMNKRAFNGLQRSQESSDATRQAVVLQEEATDSESVGPPQEAMGAQQNQRTGPSLASCRFAFLKAQASSSHESNLPEFPPVFAR